MGKKILPYNISTKMITYPFNAYYLGIMESNNININYILMKDFTKLYYKKRNNQPEIDFTKSLTLENNRFVSKELSFDKCITEEIKQAINRNYYVIVMMNEKYLFNNELKRANDYSHDWLIYGYDDSTKIFYCSGYIGKYPDRKKFEKVMFYYNDVEKAISFVSDGYIEPYPSYFRNHAIIINKYWINKKPSKQDIKAQIKRLNKPNIYKRKNKIYFYTGTKSIKKFIKKFKKNHKNQKNIFLQNIRTIYDYRVNVEMCLQYIECNNKTIIKYHEIVDKTYLCLLLSLRYNINKNYKLLEQIINILNVTQNLEEEILKKI